MGYVEKYRFLGLVSKDNDSPDVEYGPGALMSNKQHM